MSPRPKDARGGRRRRGRDDHPAPRSPRRLVVGAGAAAALAAACAPPPDPPPPPPRPAPPRRRRPPPPSRRRPRRPRRRRPRRPRPRRHRPAGGRRGDAVAPRPASHLRPHRGAHGRTALEGHRRLDRQPARLAQDRRERPRPLSGQLPADLADRSADPGRRGAVDDEVRHGRRGRGPGGVGEAPALRVAVRLLDQPPQHRHQPRAEQGPTSPPTTARSSVPTPPVASPTCSWPRPSPRRC